MDEQDREVPFGTNIKWKFFRQISITEFEETNLPTQIANVVLLVIAVLAIVLALSWGPLLPVWMFFNSLQLLLHLPLLRVRIPASANLFLMQYLDLVRMHSTTINKWVENLLGLDSGDRQDQVVIDEDQTPLYNELMKESGYHVSLWRNLAICCALLTGVTLIWAFVRFEKRICRNKKWSKADTWWNNFFVRLIYELFFEICLCTMISLAISVPEDWVPRGVAVGFTLLASVPLLLLCCLCCRNGPYIRNSYEPGSLLKSYWAFRPVR